jgi:lipopolysaccharide export system permease protein
LIKKLDILIIRSFIGPFVVTFFVALFVLVMQFFWLYMDELIGKGIGVWPIIQLLIYMSTTLVPLALPLSILLASIMTFGNMGENFELVAIKSAGISLLRFMAPLLTFISAIALLAFVFSNNVIPVANLKALSLLYDIRNSKPALNIKPDQFNNEIQGYSIHIGSKDPDGNTIHDVMIYDQTDMVGNNKLILAKEGQMLANKQTLIFKLKDGWRYEEGYNHGQPDMTQTRMHFAHWDKVFDLSSFKFTRTNEDMFKNAYQMMNVSQLGESIDSLKRSRTRNYNTITVGMAPYLAYDNQRDEGKKLAKQLAATHTLRSYDSSFLQLIPDSLRTVTLQTLSNNVRSFKSLVDINSLDKKLQDDNYLKFDVEWHKKFTLSFACVLLFLIGAPLGGIIRKGGLGMPLVIAVSFFMTWLILSTTGEKLTKAGSVAPWIGMWLSTYSLLPLAVVLINAARKDAKIVSAEVYLRAFRYIRQFIK